MLLNVKESTRKIRSVPHTSSIVLIFRVKFRTFKRAKILADNNVAIENLMNLLRDEQQGLLFVKDLVLPEYTFIAIEAIWWAIEHGEDIEDEQTGLLLFEVRPANR